MPSAIIDDSDTYAQFDGHPLPNGHPNPDRGGFADGHSQSNC
jgi:hypothetical protein